MSVNLYCSTQYTQLLIVVYDLYVLTVVKFILISRVSMNTVGNQCGTHFSTFRGTLSRKNIIFYLSLLFLYVHIMYKIVVFWHATHDVEFMQHSIEFVKRKTFVNAASQKTKKLENVDQSVTPTTPRRRLLPRSDHFSQAI